MSEEKSKKRITAPVIALLVTVLALVLAMAGTAQAALDKKTDVYTANIELTSLNVGLTENDQLREGDDTLLKDLIPKDEKFAFGRYYNDVLAAKNNGDESEYVRVSINRYWIDKDGEKATDLKPEFIELDWAAEGWVTSDGVAPTKSNTTGEQTILYGVDPLASGSSLAFVNGLRISPNVLGAAKVETVKGQKESGIYYVTTYYDYDGYKFAIDVEVASVQTHNAADAIKSAWGVDAAKLGINVNEEA